MSPQSNKNELIDDTSDQKQENMEQPTTWRERFEGMKKTLPKGINLEIDAKGAFEAIHDQGYNQALDDVIPVISSLLKEEREGFIQFLTDQKEMYEPAYEPEDKAIVEVLDSLINKYKN